MCNTLILGYGNTLRGDDGAGALAAEAIAAQALPSVDVRVLHQLLPELAAPIAAADLVIFIDAAVDVDADETLRVQHIQPASESAPHDTHISTPTGLLAMARDLFHALPRAMLVSIPAENFNFGANLSARTKRGIDEITRRIAAISDFEFQTDSTTSTTSTTSI
jgi:hydrogenase maturation protease